jgi:hypothetical protein
LCTQLDLYGQLEQAQKQEAQKGMVSGLQERLRTVQTQLDRLKVEKQEKERAYRLQEKMRQDLKVCFVGSVGNLSAELTFSLPQALEDSVHKLKSTKVQLMKRQKEEVKRHEDYQKQKKREIEALRKADRDLQRRVGKLQMENRGNKV